MSGFTGVIEHSLVLILFAVGGEEFETVGFTKQLVRLEATFEDFVGSRMENEDVGR